MKKNGTIRPAMFQVLAGFYKGMLQSDEVPSRGSHREQTTVINGWLSRQYVTDRLPRYLWMDLETITAELLQRADSLLNWMLFQPQLRKRLMERLDGVPGCWTGTWAGSRFSGRLDSRRVLLAMHLEPDCGQTMRTETDVIGNTVTLPFAVDPICARLKEGGLVSVPARGCSGNLFSAQLCGLRRMFPACLSETDTDRRGQRPGRARAVPERDRESLEP